METNNKMNLIEKKARLIQYQNQISWIAGESLKYHAEKYAYAQISIRSENYKNILLENLISIVDQIKEEGLDVYLSESYKKEINYLCGSLHRFREDALELFKL